MKEKPLYTIHLRCEAETTPSTKVKEQWKELDRVSMLEFEKPYDHLSPRQKTDLHFKINTGGFDVQGTERVSKRGSRKPPRSKSNASVQVRP